VVGAGTDSVHSTTTALVPVPAASIGSYTLQVPSVIPSSTLTSWIATIELTT
jgi:hypothetical protein